MLNINKKKQNLPVCSMCGLCCRLFLINLNENEYRSGEYLTVFDDIEVFSDFRRARKCGANLLKQHDDGSCIYLTKNTCSIHNRRPDVCRGFFCNGTEKKYEKMRSIVESARSKKT